MIRKTTLGVVISTLLLGGCGGGGSSTSSAVDSTSSSNPTSPSLPDTKGHLSGTVASGAPITGMLTLKATDGKTIAYAVKKKGAFDFDSVVDLKTPAVMQIVGGSGGKAHELYSVVLKEHLAAGVVNVTPLTQLLISRATGTSAKNVFAAPENYEDSLTVARLELAQNELKAVLDKLLMAAGISKDFDLLSTRFEANYRHIDAVLDLLDIKFDENKELATVTYRANRHYSVELDYKDSWANLSLLPEAMPVEEATEALGFLVTVDSIMESMVLEQAQDDYMAYVHPNASWFGETGTGLWEYKERTMGNEIDTGMDRYRDLSLVSVDNDNQRFEVSFTQRFESSQFSSSSRMHAWFQKDQDGKFKFLGEETELPIHLSLYLKLDSNDTADKEFAYNDWRIEVDAFPSQAACDLLESKWLESHKVEDFKGWDWDDPAFSSSLEDLNKYVTLDYVTISGPGFEKPFKLDKIFMTPAKTDKDLASCHLASSEYRFSPILMGYTLDSDNSVPDNSVYTVSYYRNGETKPFYVREINAGKGTSPMSEMMPFLARAEELSRDAGNFHYRWSRESTLVTEADLWINDRDSESNANYRVPIEDGKVEVIRTNLPDIGSVFHAAYDPYGRVINRGYWY